MSKFDLPRIKHLIVTRKSNNADSIRLAEYEFAKEVVGGDVLIRDAEVRPMAYPQSGYMTPFAATEAFAKELQMAIKTFADNNDTRAPGSEKYNPLFSSPVMLKGTWMARQVVDELGIPYSFYAVHAVMFWAQQGNKRIPRPTQLCAPDVIAHVMGLWAEPECRYHFSLIGSGWDERFSADQFIGDAQQLAYRELIDQRMTDARALGIGPDEALSSLVGIAISAEDAVRRYGQQYVERALKLQDAREAEIGSIVSRLVSARSGAIDARR